MKEENYQQMQIEGHDNGIMKFVTTSINNHIGSGIEMQMGVYDSTRKSLTYEWTSELIPGLKKQNKRILTMIDNDNYSEEYFEYENRTEIKTRELNYTRVEEK